MGSSVRGLFVESEPEGYGGLMVVVKGVKSGWIMIYFESRTSSMCVGYKRKEGAKADFNVWILSNCQDRVTVFLHGVTLQEKHNWRER